MNVVTTQPSTPIYSAAQVRELDRYAIEVGGIPGYKLMTRAAEAALRLLWRRWPETSRIVVVCGAGNNAGDGYVLARLAAQQGLNVTVAAAVSVATLKGDARTAYDDFVAQGGAVVEGGADFSQAAGLARADVIVDALFGIGLSRPLDARLGAIVGAINAADVPVLALDLPSGIDADTGQVLGAAVKAECTITFVGLKQGLYLGSAPDYVGAIEFDDLGIAAHTNAMQPAAIRIDREWVRRSIAARSQLAHKGTNGQVLAIGGGIGMAGAIRLTGEACLRVGAGLVTIATHAENVAAIVSERPELIVRGVENKRDLAPLIERADVIAIGPGLGQTSWSRALFEAIQEFDKPLVVDADALNLLAKSPGARRWILTPHPGEAARLLDTSATAIQNDRLAGVHSIVRRYGGIAILKGANTLVAQASEPPAICDRGNPAMATPGMGDVLTGVVAGLLAQVANPWVAACAGVYVHALAGDRAAARLGNVERGVIASDLFVELPACASVAENTHGGAPSMRG